MKSLVFLGFALLLASAAHAASVPTSKAAELAIHRIERLVTLHKIDENFINRFYGVSAVKLPQAQPTDPAFKASGFQVPGADGKSIEVEILMDATGKALSNTVKDGSESVNAPSWPSKDPVALSEDSMHYVLDNGTTKPELQPFYTAFANLVLNQVTDASGQIMSRATIRSTATDMILEVFLKLDGSFVSANVRKP